MNQVQHSVIPHESRHKPRDHSHESFSNEGGTLDHTKVFRVIQGGEAGNYYHLTQRQHSDLTGGAATNADRQHTHNGFAPTLHTHLSSDITDFTARLITDDLTFTAETSKTLSLNIGSDFAIVSKWRIYNVTDIVTSYPLLVSVYDHPDMRGDNLLARMNVALSDVSMINPISGGDTHVDIDQTNLDQYDLIRFSESSESEFARIKSIGADVELEDAIQYNYSMAASVVKVLEFGALSHIDLGFNKMVYLKIESDVAMTATLRIDFYVAG